MAKTALTDKAPDEALEIALVTLDEGDEKSARYALRYAVHDLQMNLKKRIIATE
jgi:hypothetical protein